MNAQALAILNDVYGYPAFRGDQEAIIESAVAGRDALVLMPTGGGKSLCYQIPALLRDGVGVVISPLIALMQDQVDALDQLGVAAAFINSSQTRERQDELQDKLRAGEIKILYVAPERLLMEQTLRLLDNLQVSLFAIDEAHCVSQWGHDFRRDYLGLNVLTQRYPQTPVMALTATADVRTREEILQRLGLREPRRFVASFDRPNIHYAVATKTDAKRQLGQFLLDHEGEAGIVYCQSRAKVERTAEQLSASGYTALPYHAGLPAALRKTHQDRFLREDGVIIVATIAFGMGIDKPDVRFVVHLDLPKSIESYYQETGRAGRDGAPAQAWMIYGLQDVVRLRQMVDSGEGEESYKRVERAKLDTLLGWCELTTCRRRELLAYFDQADQKGQESDKTLVGEPEKGCGNCDCCLSPPETFDATVPAQKLLSCIYRTEQRFGAGHVIDVLRGKSTDKTQQHGHESLSTWSIGQDLSEQQWRSVLRQLIVQGALFADQDRYGALRLNPSAREILRGERQLIMRRDAVALKSRGASSRGSGRAGSDSAQQIEAHEEPLWQALRRVRKEIAEQDGVPPYVIFHDATLVEMIKKRPQSEAAMLDVHGVGRTRLARYGERFLDEIRAFEYDLPVE